MSLALLNHISSGRCSSKFGITPRMSLLAYPCTKPSCYLIYGIRLTSGWALNSREQ